MKGMCEASQKIANTFQTFGDKEAVDYSNIYKKFSKTEMVKKPWLAKKQILEVMVLRLDAAIDMMDNLAKDVKIDQMVKNFDSLMEKTHNEKVIPVVAESDLQYGAEIFEKHEKSKNQQQNNTEIKSLERQNNEKTRCQKHNNGE